MNTQDERRPGGRGVFPGAHLRALDRHHWPPEVRSRLERVVLTAAVKAFNRLPLRRRLRLLEREAGAGMFERADVLALYADAFGKLIEESEACRGGG